MAEPETSRRNGEESAGDSKLYTLSEISQKTGISMPTLQRYKKLYQARIPAVGKGRKQRYPDSALPVFDEIKNENAGRRGRPRKDAAAARPAAAPAARKRGRPAAKPAGRPGRPAGRPAAKTAAKPAAKRGPGRPPGARRGRPPAAAKATGRGRKAAQPASKRRAGGGNLLTLTEISEQTGISYPTLVRYVRLHSNKLPHEGKGRARRFHPEAVEVFRQLRSESGRGGRKKGTAAPAARGRGRGRAAAAAGGADTGAINQRLRAIEKSQQSLEKKFNDFARSLAKLLR